MSILVKKYKIFHMHVKELKIVSLFMLIENSLWHPRIGIFNLKRTYNQKLKVSKIVQTVILVYCSFSSFLYYQAIFSFKIVKIVAFNSLHSSHVLF